MPPSSEYPRLSSLARAASRARRRSARVELAAPSAESPPALSPMEKSWACRREAASPVVPGGASLPPREPSDRLPLRLFCTMLDMAWYENRSRSALFALRLSPMVSEWCSVFVSPSRSEGVPTK